MPRGDAECVIPDLRWEFMVQPATTCRLGTPHTLGRRGSVWDVTRYGAPLVISENRLPVKSSN